eukprot:1158182-Pelagomonas_calceolata.AAC.3
MKEVTSCIRQVGIQTRCVFLQGSKALVHPLPLVPTVPMIPMVLTVFKRRVKDCACQVRLRAMRTGSLTSELDFMPGHHHNGPHLCLLVLQSPHPLRSACCISHLAETPLHASPCRNTFVSLTLQHLQQNGQHILHSFLL